ncbi:o-succinylbenzoic acid (OSB) synthetase [Oceanimonas doudoroffii]|uniref:O-succinylbenzoic acid (OSB) synthetase n=1 Tax=Oceanimonas doudoroffii TaxID=84158 RepID=A0A233RDH4_9GAMM|nr:o-succinylbenzoic acid (OSB) synthetase [Oceanimonas doudoroffii]OXY81447.1 o-succinylbenzoic acid (OSB) synthetase [Oceanimonas doudoroffii]
MPISVYRYALPLTKEKQIDGVAVRRRHGFYVNIDGHWGEVAPPVTAELADTEAELLAACERLTQGLEHQATQAWVRFGLGCVLTPPTAAAAPSLPLLEGEREPIIRAWRCRRVHPTRAWLTLSGDVQFDAGLVRELTLLVPGLKLTLDAGGRLSETQLSGLWQRIDGGAIDWILDPGLDDAHTRTLARQHGWPVALSADRCGGRVPAPFEGLRALVLRPSLLGEPALCRQLADGARAQGLDVMLAGNLESGLGHRHIAQLAGELTPNSPAQLDSLRYLLHSGVNAQGQPEAQNTTLVYGPGC